MAGGTPVEHSEISIFIEPSVKEVSTDMDMKPHTSLDSLTEVICF